MSRRAARVDSNHAEVIRALRAAGVLVKDTSRLGDGFGDAVALNRRLDRLRIIEIKDGAKPPSARRLTPAEEEFHRDWCGHVAVVTSPEEALEAMGVRLG